MNASGDTPSFISVAAVGNTASLIAAASLEESAQINQHLTTLRMRLKTRLADKRWSIFTNYEALGIKNTMDWFKSLGFTAKASKVTVIDLSMLAHEVLPFICATIGRVLLEAREKLAADQRFHSPWVLEVMLRSEGGDEVWSTISAIGFVNTLQGKIDSRLGRRF